MAGPRESAARHPAPHWGVWLFGLAIPFVVWSMLTTMAVAAGIGPLADFTPVLAIALALLTRRWSGVSMRWSLVTAALAGFMVVQWIPWYAWMLTQRWPGNDTLSRLTSIYALELLILVILLIVASVRSIRGIRKDRATAADLRVVDAANIES